MPVHDASSESTALFALEGADPRRTAMLLGFMFQGVEQAAEKDLGRVEFNDQLLQGLKPSIDLQGFIGTIRRGGSCPVTKPLEIERWVSFSAACRIPCCMRESNL
jgi:hypothetical protein